MPVGTLRAWPGTRRSLVKFREQPNKLASVQWTAAVHSSSDGTGWGARENEPHSAIRGLGESGTKRTAGESGLGA